MLLALLPVFAAGPQGGNFKNLKVLQPEQVGQVMRVYVQSLGVAQSGGCNFCHVQDKSSDENPKKATARKMIEMVKDINTKLGADAAKPAVTCFTCHRGKTTPETSASAGQP